jgi:phospholipid transport system substrate-binding protein
MIKRNLVQIALSVFTVCIVSFVPFSSFAESPTQELKKTIDSIIAELKKNRASSQETRKRRNTIRALVADRFDYEEMARRSLARHWKQRTPEEQTAFVHVFADVLEASYIGRIETYTDEKVLFNTEKIKGKGKYAVVGTTIATKKVDIPIEYKVIRKDSKWWVYDVVIEGVSFISTYRSQYDSIIRKESFEGLMKQMQKKTEELNKELSTKG